MTSRRDEGRRRIGSINSALIDRTPSYMALCRKNSQWILEVARSFPMPLNCLLLLTASVLVIVFERSAHPGLGDGGVVARISHYCYARQARESTPPIRD